MSSSPPQLIPQLFKAGAGAGKTKRLIDQIENVYDYFLENYSRPPKIVVTTFTRKATQELRERLLLRALEKNDLKFLMYVNSRGKLHISTIHGVLSILLKRYSSDFGLDPGFKVIDKIENLKIARKVIRKIVSDKGLSQRVFESSRFLDILDALIEYSNLHLREESIKKLDFIAMETGFFDFYNQLNAKLRDVVNVILNETQNEKWLNYLNSFKKLLSPIQVSEWDLRREALVEFFSQRRPSFSNSKPPFSYELNEMFKEIFESIKEVSQKDWSHPRYWKDIEDLNTEFQILTESFYSLFRLEKEKLGVVDISDLEDLTLNFIKNHPDTVKRFSAEWDYWFIDEYQDTSPSQVAILENLISESPYFIVGDPQQSIYLFRGARSEVFENKLEKVKKEGGRINLLTKNYRSNPSLLEFINYFFKSFGSGFSKMEPKEEVVPYNVAQITISNSLDEEIKSIVDKVLSLLSKDVRPEEICILTRTNKTLKEIATKLEESGVPTFVNVASGFYDRREILDALALIKFLVNSDDDTNLIQLLRSPWFRVKDDTLSLLPDEEGTSFWRKICSSSKLQGPDSESVKRLLDFKKISHESGVSFAFESALRESGLIDYSHYHDVTGRRESNLWKLLIRLKSEEHHPKFNYIQFVNKSLSQFTSDDQMDTDSDAVAATEPNRVNLMTIHKSKGLQFNYVFIPFLNETPVTTKASFFVYDEDSRYWTLPIRSDEDQSRIHSPNVKMYIDSLKKREKEESYRVLYVGLTRAVRSVFLSFSGKLKKGSWLEDIKIPIAPGEYNKKKFTYSVEEYLEGSTTTNKTREVVKKVRPKFELKSTIEKKQASVSDIVDKESSQESINSQNILNVIEKKTKGTRIHKYLEVLKYVDTDDWQEVAENLFGSDCGPVLESVDFLKSIKEFDFVNLVEKGHAEWTFHSEIEGLRVEGQIDLWGEIDGTVWVIDYKTGSKKYKEKAKKQLMIYAFVLSKFLGRRNIKICAVYPIEKAYFIWDMPEESEIKNLFVL